MRREKLCISSLVSAEVIEKGKSDTEEFMKEMAIKRLGIAYAEKYVEISFTYRYEDYHGNPVLFDEPSDQKYLNFIGKEYEFRL